LSKSRTNEVLKRKKRGLILMIIYKNYTGYNRRREDLSISLECSVRMGAFWGGGVCFHTLALSSNWNFAGLGDWYLSTKNHQGGWFGRQLSSLLTGPLDVNCLLGPQFSGTNRDKEKTEAGCVTCSTRGPHSKKGGSDSLRDVWRDVGRSRESGDSGGCKSSGKNLRN